MNYQLIIGVESAVLCLIAISFFLYYRKVRKEAEEFSSMLEQTKKRLLVISCGFDIIRSNPHEIARRNA